MIFDCFYTAVILTKPFLIILRAPKKPVFLCLCCKIGTEPNKRLRIGLCRVALLFKIYKLNRKTPLWAALVLGIMLTCFTLGGSFCLPVRLLKSSEASWKTTVIFFLDLGGKFS